MNLREPRSGRRTHLPPRRRTLRWSALAVVAGAGFILTIRLVGGGGLVSGLDPSVRSVVLEHRAAILDVASGVGTVAGSDALLAPLVAVSAGLFVARRDPRSALWLVAALLGVAVLAHLVKADVVRPRPPGATSQAAAGSWSFPSTHTAYATAVYTMLASLLARGRARPVATGLGAAAGTLVGVVAFSRLYVGAHWASDVLGGLLLGSAWAGLLLAVRAGLESSEDLTPPSRPAHRPGCTVAGHERAREEVKQMRMKRLVAGAAVALAVLSGTGAALATGKPSARPGQDDAIEERGPDLDDVQEEDRFGPDEAEEAEEPGDENLPGGGHEDPDGQDVEHGFEGTE